MTTQTEALKMALEVLDIVKMHYTKNCLINKAITAIKEALAHPKEPEQEPVAYGMWDSMIGCGGRMMYVRLGKGQDGCTVPLYTTPPQRKPLTDAAVSAAARVLNDRQAEACGVDKDDQWKVYGEDFIKDARAMLTAAHGIKGDA